jgi:hypothetical protein
MKPKLIALPYQLLSLQIIPALSTKKPGTSEWALSIGGSIIVLRHRAHLNEFALKYTVRSSAKPLKGASGRPPLIEFVVLAPFRLQKGVEINQIKLELLIPTIAKSIHKDVIAKTLYPLLQKSVFHTLPLAALKPKL